MSDAVDDALGALNERDGFSVHDECVATLTMKCGSPELAVRKKLHDEIQVPFLPDEGFAVFQTKIERHYVKIGPTYAQQARAIYLKPSTNATQSKYLLLTKENFESALRMRWKVAKSMKTELKYEVFCYFIDTTKKEKRRKLLPQHHQQDDHQATSSSGMLVDPQATGGGHGAAAVDQSHSFLTFNSISQAMQGYAEVAASLVETAGARKAAGPALRQANGAPLDSNMGGERPRKVARMNNNRLVSNGTSDSFDESQFVAIPFRINGVEVPMEIDIAALRRSLGFVPAVAARMGPPQGINSAGASQQPRR